MLPPHPVALSTHLCEDRVILPQRALAAPIQRQLKPLAGHKHTPVDFVADQFYPILEIRSLGIRVLARIDGKFHCGQLRAVNVVGRAHALTGAIVVKSDI